MKDNKNYIKKENFDKLIDAVDIVCGECLYRTERTCSKCPVRKTMDKTEFRRSCIRKMPEYIMARAEELEQMKGE